MQSLEFAQCKEYVKMVDTNNNCCKCTDPQYTIVLNSQGPQGIQGLRGEDGYSPEVSLYNVTDTNVQLKILNKENTVITPNLKAQNDITFAPWTGSANSTDGTITLQGSFNVPTEVSEDYTEFKVKYGIDQIAHVNVTNSPSDVSVVANITPTYTTLIYGNGVVIGQNVDYGLNNLNLTGTNPIAVNHKVNGGNASTIQLNYNSDYFEVNSENQLSINSSYGNNLAKLNEVNTFTGNNTFTSTVTFNSGIGANIASIGNVSFVNGNATFQSNGELKVNNIKTTDGKDVFVDNTDEARFEIGSTTGYLAFKAMTNSNLVVYRGSTSNVPSQIIDTYNMMTYLPKATTTSLGMVKPDGTTITITEDGTITSVGGGGSLPDNVLTSDNISQDEYIQSLVARIAALESLIDGGNSSND